MANWEDVRRIALALPDTDEATNGRGHLSWQVHRKSFAWERPLGKGDLKKLGDAAPPEGPILAASVADQGAKEALIADDPTVFFTIEHFNGYPAILVLLDEIDAAGLDEVLTEGWLCRAPKRLAAQYLADCG
jgi:hypothetical protein